MDAREYLARKGLDGSRDEERPNTLEEKAWERARQAGGHQPRAGTPHDWEDWERYHDALAEGAESIDQKIDHEAHRRALEIEQRQREAAEAVQHYVPAGDDATASHGASGGGAEPAAVAARGAASSSPGVPPSASTEPMPPALRFAFRTLAILLPPLAVGLSQGGAKRVVYSLALTLLGWVPGCIYAWVWLKRRLG